ncbi:MAG: sigma-70 family RNA polymerase sigma factor [candidate division Zixibacteria bacterium]|nr:sigma-70 family RNA polymerase sigma factor [candidate division Zixibacteria bacterium]
MNINELYAQLLNGNKSSETQLFDKLRERFGLFLQHKITNEADAEDVLQNTLVVIARKYLNMAFDTSFSAWAYKVLEFNILSYYRTKGRQRDKLERLTAHHNEATMEMPDADLKRRLLNCLKKVNEVNIRHARILNFSYQGFDIEQICEKLGLTKNGAYILLSRARAKLKNCMEMDK